MRTLQLCGRPSFSPYWPYLLRTPAPLECLKALQTLLVKSWASGRRKTLRSPPAVPMLSVSQTDFVLVCPLFSFALFRFQGEAEGVFMSRAKPVMSGHAHYLRGRYSYVRQERPSDCQIENLFFFVFLLLPAPHL
jgi:hypothetical protein